MTKCIFFLLVLLIGLSCNENESYYTKDYIAILRDTSGSREVPHSIDTVFLDKLEQTMIQSEHGKRIELYDLTSKAARPIVVNLMPVPPSLPAYDAKFKERQKKIKVVIRYNRLAYAEFVKKAVGPSSAPDAYKYSYLHKNIRVILPNLKDSTYQNRIILLDTDLKDDPEKGTEQFLSKGLVSDLNAAINNGANVFLYTETDRSIIDSIGLSGKLLTHPNHFLDELNRLYKINNPLTYEQLESQNRPD